MNRRVQIISILLHALLILIAYVFQGMIFPFLRFGGLVPLIMPIISTGVAVCEGRNAGGIAGLFAGILCDISFNNPVGVFTVLLTLTGLFIGVLADTLFTRGFVTYILSCAAVLMISAFVQIFPFLVFERTPAAPLFATAIDQTAYSLFVAVPFWFFVRALGNRAQRVSPTGRPL